MSDSEQSSLSALYQRTRDEAPSELLDQRIKNAARQQAKKRRNPWVWGISSAAVLVLSTSLVLQIGWNTDEVAMAPLMLPPHSQADRQVAPRFADLPAETEAVANSMADSVADSVADSMRELESSAGAAMRELDALNAQSIAQPTMSAPKPSAIPAPAKRLSSAAPAPMAKSIAAESAADARLNALEDQGFADSVNSQSMPAPRKMSRTSLPDVPKLPQLPTALDSMHVQYSELEVTALTEAQWQVLFFGQTILRATVLSRGTRFEAWRGAEIVGVQVDWNVQRSRFVECVVTETDPGPDLRNEQCPWGDQAQAVFKSGQLDSVRWVQY